MAHPSGSISQDSVRGDGPCPEAARPVLWRTAEGQCWMISGEPQGSGDASTGPEPTSLRARRRREGGLSILLMRLPEMCQSPPKRANSRLLGAETWFLTQPEPVPAPFGGPHCGPLVPPMSSGKCKNRPSASRVPHTSLVFC